MFCASKKVDYGIMLMGSLPEPGNQEFMSLAELAGQKKLSANFLSQVVRPLKDAGLVTAKEGLGGGYQLAKPKKEISIYDIYEAIDGPLSLTSCMSSDSNCACDAACPSKEVWTELQQIMKSYFQNKKLSELDAITKLYAN